RELPRGEAGQSGGESGERAANGPDGDSESGDRADVDFAGESNGRGFGGGFRFRGRDGGFGGAGEFFGGSGFGGGGAFGHLFLDHPDELFVRGPEGLADADRVIDDARDGGVP